jgi:hypothetical protein
MEESLKHLSLNSVAVERRISTKMVELFAGCGGLAIWKQSTFRIAKKEHPELWETNKDLKDVDELFLPNWEEELRDVQPGKKYSLRVDLNNFYQLGRAEMTQKIVRYFRKLGFPVCRDFIGRVEVWIPQELSDFILFNRFALRPYYRDVTDGWQIDVAHVGTSRCSKQTIFETNLEDNGFLVVAGTEVLHRQDVKQYHMQKFQGGHPVINTYTSRELHIPMQQTYDRNKLVTKRDKITQFIQTYLMTQAFQDALDINILNNGNFIAVKEENITKVDAEAHHLIYGDKYVGSSPKGEFTHHGPYKMPEPHTFFIICSKKNKEWRNRLYNILQNGIDSTLINGQGVEHGSLCTFTPLPNLLNQPLNWEKNLSLTYNTNDTALKELKNHLSENNRIKPDKKYTAIIISDISKDSTDKKAHELYYRMKEQLMKYGVTSQVIYAPKIGSSKFNYILPNIAAALVAKQNGMPWGLKKLSQHNDMIVGIGASRQVGMKSFLGTAFCFDQTGQFREFDCCEAGDVEALAASLKKALIRFCRTYGEPQRLIIHYYKKLNQRESRRIEDLLLQVNVNCSVYVVNVVTAVNDDLIAFDTSQQNLMPVSGTIVRLRDMQFLLYSNEKYSDNGPAKVLLPIKLTITNTNTNIGETLPCDDAKDIITQVFQFCKSVAMQNKPITVAYPEMLTQFVPHFKDNKVPEFGKHSLWML